jgi:hypothetical protein
VRLSADGMTSAATQISAAKYRNRFETFTLDASKLMLKYQSANNPRYPPCTLVVANASWPCA